MTLERLALRFVAPRHQDRMLALQLGELSPRGVDLECDVGTDIDLDAGDWDLAEVPLADLLSRAGRGDRPLGLPVFPAREERDGALLPTTVIAIRAELAEARPDLAPALLDAFEAARARAYARLKLITSPALALPWLVDEIAADEGRFGGDPFPVGFAANRVALERAAAAQGLEPSDLADLFAPGSADHLPVAAADEREAPAPGPMAAGSLRCRALRYVDRTLPLETGAVADDAMVFTAAPSLGGALPAVLSGEVEIAEILLGDLVAELAERRDRLVGLPVFPARRFAHRYLWVPVGSPARSLTDLAGARVGYPPGGATAAVWTSALLEHAGVDAGFEPGPLGGALARMLDRGASGPTLTARLAAGELDAVCTPYAIPAADGGDLVRPLLADPAAAEREEARASGPPPISNVLAMNRAAYERDPGRVPAIIDSFRRAREVGRSGLLATPATAALPRIAERIEGAEAACGGDPYPYGLEANRAALMTFGRHAAAIGMVADPPEVAAMFPPEAAAG